MSQRFTSIMREDAEYLVSAFADRSADLVGRHLLLSGAAGFLGGAFLDFCAAFNRAHPDKPLRVTALDNFRSGLPERIAHFQDTPNITLIDHDVTKPYRCDGPVDFIIHSASVASPIFYRRFPLETIDVNVNGTWRLLELAIEKKTRSFVFFSSSEIYGDPDAAKVPTSEDYFGNVSSTGPRACYDESKRLGETLCTTMHRQLGLPVKIVRPFNVYGPGQRLDDQRIIPDMVSASLARAPLVLFSDGRPTRAFCYVRDYVEAVLAIMLSDYNGEAFNVGNDNEVSIAELARTMASIAQEPPLPVEFRTSGDADYLTDNPQRRCPNLTKLKTLLQIKPRVSLREGLGRTFRSYREALGEIEAS